MKFIILTCLLAVALAKQRMEQYSSGEESKDNSQEDFKQTVDVVIFPGQESVEAPIKVFQQQYNQKTMDLSMRAREKIVMSEIKKNIQDYVTKMKQYSKITWPRFVKSLQQYQKTMNPWSCYPYTLLQV
uniref:Casein alpha s2-like B n=1 Tax=Rattus norvegicus TaxID=10116 RepID=A0A0G2K8M6_RAT